MFKLAVLAGVRMGVKLALVDGPREAAPKTPWEQQNLAAQNNMANQVVMNGAPLALGMGFKGLGPNGGGLLSSIAPSTRRPPPGLWPPRLPNAGPSPWPGGIPQAGRSPWPADLPKAVPTSLQTTGPASMQSTPQTMRGRIDYAVRRGKDSLEKGVETVNRKVPGLLPNLFREGLHGVGGTGDAFLGANQTPHTGTPSPMVSRRMY